MSFHVFKRSWWKKNPSWPNGLEPYAGKKLTIRTGVRTEEEARELCREWNRDNKPGKYSLKAEYEEQ